MIFIKTFVTTATYSQRPLSFDGKVHLLRFERYLDIFLRSGLVPKKTRPHPALLLLPTAFWRERSEEKSQSADSGRMPFRVYSYMLYSGGDGGCRLRGWFSVWPMTTWLVELKFVKAVVRSFMIDLFLESEIILGTKAAYFGTNTTYHLISYTLQI